MTAHLETYTVPATAPHTHTLIFLHGRGSDARAFCDEIFESQNSSGHYFPETFPGVKWVFPCAKKSWAETDQEEMHQWFDMTSVQHPNQNSERQIPALLDCAHHLQRLIEDEAKIVGCCKVFLAGMSQGCAIGIYTLLTKRLDVAGFIGLSGWMPKMDHHQNVASETDTSSIAKSFPILLQHCQDDYTVPVENGTAMKNELEAQGFKAQWHCFTDGGHWLNEPLGVDRIMVFLAGLVSGASPV